MDTSLGDDALDAVMSLMVMTPHTHSRKPPRTAPQVPLSLPPLPPRVLAKKPGLRVDHTRFLPGGGGHARLE